jgi:hypothetical protein
MYNYVHGALLLLAYSQWAFVKSEDFTAVNMKKTVAPSTLILSI